MSKHARFTLTLAFAEHKPEHSTGWSVASIGTDWVDGKYPRTPGKHANPFGKHHPATPTTDEIPTNVIALRTAPALAMAA